MVVSSLRASYNSDRSLSGLKNQGIDFGTIKADGRGGEGRSERRKPGRERTKSHLERVFRSVDYNRWTKEKCILN